MKRQAKCKKELRGGTTNPQNISCNKPFLDLVMLGFQ